jgi:hypothetical protein
VKTIVGTPRGNRSSTPRIGSSEKRTEFRRRQQAAPRVEQHDGVGAGRNLLAQVSSDGVGVDGDEPREQIRARIRHSPHAREVGAAAAFDHVAGERERTARESDQRHAARERALDFGDGVEHVAQVREIRCDEFRDGLLVGSGAREARSLAFGKREPEPIASGTVRMSEKRIAASRSKRASGCSVTSVASDGDVASAMKLPARARSAAYSGR